MEPQKVDATGLLLEGVNTRKLKVDFIHLAVDYREVTNIWTRLWAVVQIPWFLLVYIIRGKAIIK